MSRRHRLATTAAVATVAATGAAVAIRTADQPAQSNSTAIAAEPAGLRAAVPRRTDTAALRAEAEARATQAQIAKLHRAIVRARAEQRRETARLARRRAAAHAAAERAVAPAPPAAHYGYPAPAGGQVVVRTVVPRGAAPPAHGSTTASGSTAGPPPSAHGTTTASGSTAGAPPSAHGTTTASGSTAGAPPSAHGTTTASGAGGKAGGSDGSREAGGRGDD